MPPDPIRTQPAAGPTDGERRRAFRQFVLAHHPDRGGDPEKFRLGVERFRRGGTTRPPGPVVVAHRTPSLRGRVGAALRRLGRRQPPRTPRVR